MQTVRDPENADGLTFDTWKKQMNWYVMKLTGLETKDFEENWHYWDSWNEDMNPEQAAYDFLMEQGYPIPL